MAIPRIPLAGLSVLSLAALAVAQTPTYQWSPPNTGSIPGNSNNTIPFWGQSATYQQVHDAPTLSSSILVMKGLAMRPSGSRTVKGRSWDLRLTLSQTSVSAITASTTFSTNLGSSNTSTVFATAATFKTFSWPDFTTSGTTPAFTIPFAGPYTYIAAVGNLCWEWRHKNASINTIMPMDASDAQGNRGSVLTSSGTGCTATGRTGPATATMAAVQTSPPDRPHHLEVRLANAAANANGMLAIGLAPTTTPIGWCAPVITPALLVPMQADAAGSFTLKEGLVRLSGSPSFSLYTQFGFGDAGIPGGIGLTNVAGYTTPNIPGSHGISRIYRSPYNSTSNGDELATSGSATRGYGLSIGWLQ